MRQRYGQGYSLSELMIAMLLGILISTAIIHLLVTLKNQQRYATAIHFMNSNLLTFDTLMAAKVKSVYNAGCLWLNDDPVIFHHYPNIQEQYAIERHAPIHKIHDIHNKPTFPKHMLPRLKEGSDIIWMNHFVETTLLAHDAYALDDKILVSEPILFKPNQVVVVHDCQQIDFLKVYNMNFQSNVKRKSIALASPYPSLSKIYRAQHSQFSILESGIYLIADTLRRNQNGEPIYGLYVIDLNGRTIELMEGVHSLYFEFGIRTPDGLVYIENLHSEFNPYLETVRCHAQFHSIEPDTHTAQVLKKNHIFEWRLKHV